MAQVAPNSQIEIPNNFDMNTFAKEFIDDESPGEDQFATDSASTTVIYDVPWNFRYQAVLHTLGYHYTEGTRLRRVLPLRHPFWRSLYATKVSANGYQFDAKVNGDVVRDAVKMGAYGAYNYYRMRVTFEALPYAVKSDQEAAAEWQRYLTLDRDPAEDAILMQAGNLTFTEGSGTGGQPLATETQFPQTIGLIQAKEMLRRTWMWVPEDFVTDEDGNLPRFAAAIGKVNESDFLGYPAGTLLFRAPQIERRTQAAANLRNGGQSFVLNITLNLQVFDPPRGATSPDSRGHNMMPYSDRRYYYATDDGTDTGNAVYEEFEFSQVFEHHSLELA